MAISSLAAELDPPADAPVLVLGNSMGTTARVWEPQLAQFRRHFRLPGREPDVPASFVAGLAQVAAEGYAGCCEAIGAMDLRASLPAITAPTLVIAGSEDPATPPWHGAVIASAIPEARLAVVRGAAHLASVSAPGQVGCALLGFLLG